MALKKCNVCSNQISVSASVCPHCGHNHQKDADDKKNIKQIFLILAGIVILMLLMKFEVLDDVLRFLWELVKRD